MRHRRGFTLIELIIYVGIFSIAAGLLIGVLTTFTKVQVRESATTAVSQEAQFVIQTIQRLVTDASLIELEKDSATSTLKLRMPVAGLDPTCIQFSNGTVYLMQGNDGANKQTCFATSTAQAKALTTSKVVVNSLTFKKFENPPSTDTVKIDLTISYNSTNPQESAISRTLQTAIAKVSAATFDSNIIPSADTQYDVGIGGNRWRNGLFSNSLLVGYTSITGGVAAFNGNVGIGTASPGALLHVAGGAIISTQAITTTNAEMNILFVQADGTISKDTILTINPANDTFTANGIVLGANIVRNASGNLSVKVADDASYLLLNQAGGNGGIGTATPNQKLSVNGKVNIGGNLTSVAEQLLVETSAGGGSLRLTDNSNSAFYINHPSTGVAFLGVGGATQILQFGDHDAPTTWMTLKAGNVGIGAANPSSKLQVAGGDVGLGDATATGNQPVTIWLTNGSGAIRSAGEIVVIGGPADSCTTS